MFTEVTDKDDLSTMVREYVEVHLALFSEQIKIINVHKETTNSHWNLRAYTVLRRSIHS
jgi:hypothetical protein